MRKYLPYAHFLALGAGILGMLLQFLLRLGGTDEKGLYPAAHPAWVILCILTPIVLVAFWLLACQAGNSRSHRSNFPASIWATAGYCAAAVCLVIAGIQTLRGTQIVYKLSGWLGILNGAFMLLGGWCRFQGKKSTFLPHALSCFFFASQLFVLGQLLGAEPEACRYLFRFFAMISMIPACYWLWSFDVNMGNRKSCLFWCLAAAYLNLVAVGGSGQWLLHLGMAAWLLVSMPALRYLPQKTRPVPAEEPQAPAVEPIAPQDVDAMLDQILSELDSNP